MADDELVELRAKAAAADLMAPLLLGLSAQVSGIKRADPARLTGLVPLIAAACAGTTATGTTAPFAAELVRLLVARLTAEPAEVGCG